MSDPLFKDADEQERLLAPQQVPGEGQERARLEGDLLALRGLEFQPRRRINSLRKMVRKSR